MRIISVGDSHDDDEVTILSACEDRTPWPVFLAPDYDEKDEDGKE